MAEQPSVEGGKPPQTTIELETPNSHLRFVGQALSQRNTAEAATSDDSELDSFIALFDAASQAQQEDPPQASKD